MTPLPLYLFIAILFVLIVLAIVLAYSLNIVYRIYHSKRHLESAFDSLNDPIAVIDNSYTILRVNKSFTQLTGKTFQDVLSKNCYAVLRNRTSPCEDCSLISVLQSGSQKYVSRSPHPNNQKQASISISTYPFSEKHPGSGLCILEHLRDTTELEKIKSELEGKNERLIHITKVLKKTQQEIRDELLLARQVQRSIMPQKPPDFHGLDLFLLYQPIETVCGDIYDMIQLSPNRLGIFVGDVSGHSVSSALVSMISKMSFYLHTKNRMTPHLLLSHLNDDLTSTIGTSHFLTGFYGIFDRRDNSFTYARAGHPAPVVLKKNGQVVTLSSRGTVLGILNNQFFEQRRVYLEEGDRCLVFTDGIYEMEESVGGSVHVFGYKRFIEKVLQTRSLPIHEVVPFIKNEFAAMKHEDDYTLLAFEVTQNHAVSIEEKYPGFTRLDHISIDTFTTTQETESYFSFLETEMRKNDCPAAIFPQIKDAGTQILQEAWGQHTATVSHGSVTIAHAFTPSDIKFCITTRNPLTFIPDTRTLPFHKNSKGNAVSFIIPRVRPL